MKVIKPYKVHAGWTAAGRNRWRRFGTETDARAYAAQVARETGHVVAVERDTRACRIPGLHISGRRWFQRTYGNTYHSVTIYREGCEAVHLGPVYGYGDCYIQTAMDYLRANGYPYVEYGTAYLREVLGGTATVCDVARERDL